MSRLEEFKGLSLEYHKSNKVKLFVDNVNNYKLIEDQVKAIVMSEKFGKTIFRV